MLGATSNLHGSVFGLAESSTSQQISAVYWKSRATSHEMYKNLSYRRQQPRALVFCSSSLIS